ncbi:MarR family transcriptional regulator [Fusobacterium simiae]|uniref:MarR family winged helix-turn-helix transcriptional regulator n=1 Tax=Fusobacterium simiae TaxID=855 RepID=UPI0020C4F5D0|nr:MarR family transcriptional regulator [Fusobacterium simiae]MDC7954230.1 MarR family transcriptional regulator [Fusobacterium simiae]
MQRLGRFLITKLKQLHSRALTQCISEKGIEAFSGEQGKILFVLWQKNKISQKELANETGLAKNTITVMLERMEKNNLIKRIADENDKRKSLVILTDYANTLKKCSDEISDEMTKKMYKDFREEEIDKFEEYLQRIIKNFEEKRRVKSDDKSSDKIIDRRF